MEKISVNPAKSSRKSIALLISAAAIGAAVIGTGSYWYTHRPPTVPHYLAKGDYYVSQGKLAMAMQEYQAAAALNKSDAAPYLAMSKLEEAAGNLGAAADRLGTVLYYHPNTLHIQCRRAQLYGMANRYETAYMVACDAVKIEPNCPAAHNDMGMLLEQVDDVQGAATELGKAHSLSPDDEALTLDYARVLAKAGKPLDARNIVDSVLPVTKKFKVPANYLEGWLRAEYGKGTTKDYDQAQIYLGAALSENHNHTASLAESGRIFLRRGSYVAAQLQLERAFRMGPDTLEMIADLVAVYQAQKSPKYAEALNISQQMTEMLAPLKTYRRQWINHPDDLDNRVKLATAEMGAGNMLDAYNLVKEIMAKDPKTPGALELYNKMRNSPTPVK